MERIHELVLIAGLIIVCTYSMKISHESIESINKMNHQIQMMFVKS